MYGCYTLYSRDLKIVACLDGLLNNVCACLRVVKLYRRIYSNEQTRIEKA